PAEFRERALPQSRIPPSRPPVLRAALFVAPHGFRVSEQSAQDNRYMRLGDRVDLERAHAQHQALAAKLLELGVPVVIFRGREGEDDGVFPNNVFATIPRRLIVGSMLHPVRRREAEREDIRSLFGETFGYETRDLSASGGIAELTGALVLDRPRGIGFCGMTQRVDDLGCRAMHDAFDLELTFRFDLADGEYHTNLVLAILAGRVSILHPGSFRDPEAARAIADFYSDGALVLDDDEKAAFAGNAIAVTERDVLFSNTSLRALRRSSRDLLEKRGFRVHGVTIDELEKGGGSLRCLIAEIF
ncbi:MAG TPA: arginine deiminase-related protein, partial [Planctomycetota bacterium]|nr:arginine deiminase-related protein [Planctomycetota bacterium]